MSGRTLSKGTLGLKFMNKVKPVDPQAESSNPPPPSPAPASTSTSQPVRAIDASTSKPEQTKSVQVGSTPKATSSGARALPPAEPSKSPTIIHERSLLSFPLLSTASSSSSSTRFSSSYYNSMPLTSVAVSGRRSFGGANQEIENLNNPPPPSQPKEVSSKDAEDSHQRKKKRKSDDLLNPRRSDLSFSSAAAHTSNKPSTSFASNHDELKLSGASSSHKKPRREVIDNRGTFARPTGFDDVIQKGKKKVPFEEHEWDQEGITRQWDVGKELGSSSDDDDDESASSEEGENAFGAAVDSLFAESKKSGKVERALQAGEMEWDQGEGVRAKAGKAKKQPQAKKKQQEGKKGRKQG